MSKADLARAAINGELARLPPGGELACSQEIARRDPRFSATTVRDVLRIMAYEGHVLSRGRGRPYCVPGGLPALPARRLARMLNDVAQLGAARERSDVPPAITSARHRSARGLALHGMRVLGLGGAAGPVQHAWGVGQEPVPTAAIMIVVTVIAAVWRQSLLVGDRLPLTENIAAQFATTVEVVERALERLVADGWLWRAPSGSCHFVALTDR
jgi:DNA-binding FadR family transcriptional regulator